MARYLAVALSGFLGGAFVLYAWWVTNGPELRPWHTEKLTAEFTTQKSNEIGTLDAYLRLEDELFAQLQEQVYGQIETGAEFALARYSTGSLADPSNLAPNWNRTFELTSENPVGGVLLLHGMSDSPYSLRALGENLNALGYLVIGLRLPGHGTAPSGLTTASWQDMAAAVRLGMQHLASSVGSRPVHIVGYSNGAALALNHALDVMDGTAQNPPASLVLISPSIGISPAAALASWTRALSNVPGLGHFAWTDVLPEFDPFKYNSFTANAADQVHRLTSSIAQRIEARFAAGPIQHFPPTLAFLSAVDATVSVDAVIDNLLEHLAPEGHKLVLFDINRNVIDTSLLVSDPGPLTSRLLANEELPFVLTVVGNENPGSDKLAIRRQTPFSTGVMKQELDMSWPTGVISLSHVALPFPPDDPVYGVRGSGKGELISLGQIAIQGERGLLAFPSDWLLRLRHNPFYDLLETRAVDWVDEANR